jgi:hypothetical protein
MDQPDFKDRSTIYSKLSITKAPARHPRRALGRNASADGAHVSERRTDRFSDGFWLNDVPTVWRILFPFSGDDLFPLG